MVLYYCDVLCLNEKTDSQWANKMQWKTNMYVEGR